MRATGIPTTPTALAKVDGRSSLAHRMRRVRDALTKHIGGRPSEAQKVLINRAVMLTLHIQAMDERMLAEGSFTELDSRTYLAWSNTLTRTMVALGLETRKGTPAPRLMDHLRRAAGNTDTLAAAS